MTRPWALPLRAAAIAAVAAWMMVSAGTAHAQSYDWGAMAIVSGTMGVNANRLCIGEATRGDIGCPDYAPSVTTVGMEVSGTISATRFVGDGSSLTGIASAGTFVSLTDVSYSAVGGNIFGPGSLSGAVVGVSFSTALGVQALASNISGYRNTAVGYQSLASNTVGYQNIALGTGALRSNINGYQNVAVGNNALRGISSSLYNTAVGVATLSNLSSGRSNSVVGQGAFLNLDSGSYNAVLGVNAGYSAASGQISTSVLIGYQAGYGLTMAQSNTLIGYQAGSAITTGNNNIVIGTNLSPYSNTGDNQLNLGNVLFGDLGNGSTLQGKLGINVTSPTQSLEVSGTISATSLRVVDRSSTIGISGTAGQLLFARGDGGATGKIGWSSASEQQEFNITNSTGLGYITMNVNLNNAGTSREVFRVNNDGHLTVGATSATGTIGFRRGFDGSEQGKIGYVSATNPNNFSFQNGTGSNLGYFAWLLNNGTNIPETMRLTSGGQLSIGISASAVAGIGLQVSGTVSATRFVGDGSGLTGLPSSNLSETIALNDLSDVSISTALETVFMGSGVGNGSAVSRSVGIGTGALSSNISGRTATAVGANALSLNTTGNNNTALGYSSLASNTIGSNNTALGVQALSSNTTGSNNVGVGVSALMGLTAANNSNNTGVGAQAGRAMTTGTSNTLVGYNAGGAMTSGNNNIIIGANLSPFSNTGNNQLNLGNVLFGDIGLGSTLQGKLGVNVTSPTAALEVSGTVSATRFVGDGSGLTGIASAGTFASLTDVSYSAVGGNIFGPGSLPGASGSSNTAFGVQALAANSGGIRNTAVGAQALTNATSGNYNTALGMQALASTTTGSNNTAIGDRALIDNYTGTQNVAVGNNALRLNQAGNDNVAVGVSAFRNTSSTGNVGIGTATGYGNVSGDRNVTAGAYAFYNPNGSGNVVVGNRAAYGASGGAISYSVVLGYNAGTSLTTAQNNILVGYNAGAAVTTGSGNIVIGSSISPYSNTGSNQLNLGNVLFGDLGNGSTLQGKLGINVTSPTAALEVSGTVSATGDVKGNTLQLVNGPGDACTTANGGALKRVGNRFYFCRP